MKKFAACLFLFISASVGFSQTDTTKKEEMIYDMPEIIAMSVETIDREGPYGAKEAGEGPLNPIIPAIANAVYAASHARVESTPITPDKIQRALREAARATTAPTPQPEQLQQPERKVASR